MTLLLLGHEKKFMDTGEQIFLFSPITQKTTHLLPNRRASLAEITTQAFVNQYNNGKDDDDDGDVSCSLSVTDVIFFFFFFFFFFFSSFRISL